MSCQKHIRGLGGDAKLGDPTKKEQDIRGGALLHQQRRLKQATQFVHKDSADLLPLDQLRRLGTSKDLQPHSVIQRRLLEGSPGREPSALAKNSYLLDKGIHSVSETIQPPKWQDEAATQQPNFHDKSTPLNLPSGDTVGWKGDSVFIPCKVCKLNVKAKLCTDRQQNLISQSCVERLRLLASNDNIQSGHHKELIVDIELGTEKLQSKATIVDDDMMEFCLGLETLISLKSCIDLSNGILKTPFQEIGFINPERSGLTTEKTETVANCYRQGLQN
ncbi:nuclear receptor-interacting protein 2 [Pelobates fuscus]|uniref:nuclear receptor-interacting protein 2 n=1 Tax=Pelobates fuscus TaxID=191477 RepID=UPI002FE46611